MYLKTSEQGSLIWSAIESSQLQPAWPLQIEPISSVESVEPLFMISKELMPHPLPILNFPYYATSLMSQVVPKGLYKFSIWDNLYNNLFKETEKKVCR